jgi:Lactate racemase N-terminal domain
VDFPKMVVVEQKIPAAPAYDIPQEVTRHFTQSGLLQKIKPGSRIALGAGSRGIVNIREIVIATIEVLKSTGAEIFIVPSMGSHGGGTPEGQAHVLEEYGITPQSTGVLIDTRMDARKVGTTPAGTDVFTAEAAMEADGIVLINRIKPHTDFSGAFGSGLMKMCVIGLGKHKGAIAMHAAASRLGHEACIRAAARVILQHAPVLGGLALIEDQNHQTAVMEVVAAADFETREAVLFQKAKELMPKLPFDEIDLLIVDEMGKDISGAGMDTNVIGRSVYGYHSWLLPPEPGKRLHIHRIFVRDLSHATDGNAVGIGMADFVTTRCAEAVKKGPTYTNSLTALTPYMAKIPIHFDTDRECIERALTSLALPDLSKARVVRIVNTLSLKRVQVSESYKLDGLEVKSAAKELEFNEAGNLAAF